MTTPEEIVIRCASVSSLWDWMSVWWGCRKIKFANWMIRKADALQKWGQQ